MLIGRLALTGLLVGACATPAWSQTTEVPSPRESLRGAPPVFVLVLYSPEAAVERLLRPVGGSVETIRNRVELRLRVATIPVVSIAEANPNNSREMTIE